MSNVPHLTLVLGGARAGKSAHAERLAAESGLPVCYIATATAGDPEMMARIAAHRAGRDPSWMTIEAAVDLTGALAAEPERLALVDCLTLWLSNLMLGGHAYEMEIDLMLAACARRKRPIVMVSNEVGLGLVPETPLGRQFRDAHGRMNQRAAAAADRVLFIAAGLPLVLK
jgi:adenosylcobinamide kinase / adenosylcobinamide-phosphate guanylyltransferase